MLHSHQTQMKRFAQVNYEVNAKTRLDAYLRRAMQREQKLCVCARLVFQVLFVGVARGWDQTALTFLSFG